jgi:rhodanese-related sulfurtransferase
VTTIDESLVRWCPAADALERQTDGAIFLDTREPPEFYEGTLPGALLLGQSALMFDRDAQRPLLDELKIAAVEARREIILFGNTAGPAGGHCGRDLWVLNFLWEVEQVPIDRLARLEGGLRRWRDDGRPLQPGRTRHALDDVGSAGGDAERSAWLVLLERSGLSHLASELSDDISCAACYEVLRAGGRPALLCWLQQKGCSKLVERQKLSSVIAKSLRAVEGS